MNRIAAIVAADVRIRFRRMSTLVIFLLLSALAYFWVPDPRSGSALMVLDGRRAVYNSGAVGVGTAMLATVFIGLIGFYVISNAVRRDAQTRCGFVIASTTMRGTEYLAGKFAGNVIFLSTFMAGFMVSAMVMQIVRGEARLQPLVFMWQYVLLVPPTVMFVSGMAILFESMPFLSGKFGDVVYFFLWALTLAVVAATLESGGTVGAGAYFDFSGFGFLLDTMRQTMHTTHMSIGHTSWDVKKGVFEFSGLQLQRKWIAPRIVAAIAPAALVFVARPFFHRFDPVRVKVVAAKSGWRLFARIGMLAKPLTRTVGIRGGAVASDVLMTIASSPAILLFAIGFAIASLVGPARGVLMVAMAVAAVVIADISCREKRSGTTALVFTAPALKSRFVFWKFASSFLVAAVVVIGPALLARTPYVLVGLMFVAAFATMLGVVSGNPKTFIVLFLTFWYVVVSDKSRPPALDFAGFNGSATPTSALSYVLMSAVALVIAEAYHRFELRRNW